MKQTLTLALVATIVTVSAIAVVQYQQDDSLAAQEKGTENIYMVSSGKVQAMPGQLLGKKRKGTRYPKGNCPERNIPKNMETMFLRGLEAPPRLLHQTAELSAYLTDECQTIPKTTFSRLLLPRFLPIHGYGLFMT